MSNTIYAVRVIQPWEKDAEYWIPQLYDELKAGRARFGWGYGDNADLNKIQAKINNNVTLNEHEQNQWSHAWFLLHVQDGDYFVYLNMPEYGKCTVVQVKGGYEFTNIWDAEGYNDFRHQLKCDYICEFDRNSPIVHPFLQRRLGLQRAWYRIYAKEEFKKLLEDLKNGEQGKTAEERYLEQIDKGLDNLAYEAYRHFPGKKLEELCIEVLRTLPNVKDVRKGPDVNGADLELDFELVFGNLQINEKWAVQVKSYEGDLGYIQAINDIRKAFNSNQDYRKGLIVSTALQMTSEFEAELKKLKDDFKDKDVLVLMGKDLSRLLIEYRLGLLNNKEE